MPDPAYFAKTAARCRELMAVARTQRMQNSFDFGPTSSRRWDRLSVCTRSRPAIPSKAALSR